MRILVCTDNFYPGIGGTEAAVLGYVNALVAKGHEVLLACPEYGVGSAENYPFEIVRFPSLRVIPNNPIALTHISRKKMKKLVEFAPDFVHLQTLSGMARIGIRVGRKRHVPIVMTMHTKLLEAYRQYLKTKWLSRLLLRTQLVKVRYCDAIATVANCMLPEIGSYPCSRMGEIRVIRNGSVFEKRPADEAARAAARNALGLEEGENVLLFVGRLLRYKMVSFVLHSLNIARSRGLSFRYIVVGDGEDRVSMQKDAEALGLSDAVTFTGRISDRAVVRQYYIAADLFVTASLFDTDPIVVMEAASNGVASLVAENSGCSERISDGVNGYTAPVDEEKFAEKIAEIFADKSKLREAGIRAAETVTSSWADTAEAYLSLCNELQGDRFKKLNKGGGAYRALTASASARRRAATARNGKLNITSDKDVGCLF